MKIKKPYKVNIGDKKMSKILRITDTGLIKLTSLDAVAGNTLASMLGIEHSKMLRTINRVIQSENERKKDTATNGFIFRAIFKEMGISRQHEQNTKNLYHE